MNAFNRFMLSFHRITGVIIAAFFLMWFATGLVLLYHPYPRLDESKANALMETLPDSIAIPDLDGKKVESLVLTQVQGQSIFSGKADGKRMRVCADTLEKIKKIDYAATESIAGKWVNARIIKADTLQERAQWVLYSRYERDLPIYKFYFDDPEATQVFVSSKSGKVLQTTTRSQRFWAWCGAIPHKLYFPAIRKDSDTWKFWITCGGILCLLASISGIYAGLFIWLRHRRKAGDWKIPFKEFWLKWHLRLGLIFALPLLAWSISGVFSMQRVPKWMVPMQGPYFFDYETMWGETPADLADYKLDYRALKEAYPDLRSVEWTRFCSLPAYRIIAGDREICVDASSPEARPLEISEAMVAEGVKRLHGESARFSVAKIDRPDDLYYSVGGDLELPVYKVTVDNSDGDIYYVSPTDGHVTYLNHNKILRKYLFSGIHYLNLKCFSGHSTLRLSCLWIVCITGSLFCLGSCVIGIRWLVRKVSRRNRKQ